MALAKVNDYEWVGYVGDVWPYEVDTKSYNHPTGADGFLLVALSLATSSGSPAFSSVFYGGDEMEELLNYNDSDWQVSQRYAFYGLKNPKTGSNNLVTTVSPGASGGPLSMYVCSFTGSGGAGNIGNTGALNTPNSQSLTVSEGSAIYAFGQSTNAGTTITIDGSSRPLEMQHNNNKIIFGAVSAMGLPAGPIAVAVAVTWNVVTNIRIEIKEAVAVSSRRIFLVT